jgi:hypothetical protein
MKKYAAFLVLFLTFVPSFASRIQPSQFSQFHVHRSRLSHKTISTPDLEAHSRRPVAPTTAAPANVAATKQQLKALFKRRTESAAATVAPSFITAARTPLGGADDDNTEPVMGDFNGDGKKDVAKNCRQRRHQHDFSFSGQR